MISYFLLLVILNLAYSFEPSCLTCKYYVPKEKEDLGICTMFKNKITIDDKDILVPNFALHCRSNENLCGKRGFLYEQKNYEKFENYEYIKNLCCGEFTDEEDLKDLDKIEKDLVDVFQKMRRHNTKKVYKTANEIYKLLKNK